MLRLGLPRGLLTKIVERILCLAGLIEEFLNISDCSSDTVGGELLHVVSPSGAAMAGQVLPGAVAMVEAAVSWLLQETLKT